MRGRSPDYTINRLNLNSALASYHRSRPKFGSPQVDKEVIEQKLQQGLWSTLLRSHSARRLGTCIAQTRIDICWTSYSGAPPLVSEHADPHTIGCTPADFGLLSSTKVVYFCFHFETSQADFNQASYSDSIQALLLTHTSNSFSVLSPFGRFVPRHGLQPRFR